MSRTGAPPLSLSAPPRAIRRWAGASVALALLSAPLVTRAPLTLLAVGLISVSLVVGVSRHPPLAAYVLLVLTPLTAGLPRGFGVPLLRPPEVLAILVGAGLLARALPALLAGRLPRPRLSALDGALLAMAVASSVLPLLGMLARGATPSLEDLLFASTLWKYYAVFLIIHTSVRTEADVRRCLWLTLAAGSVVAVVAALQSLSVAGVPELLARVYEAGDNGASYDAGRGTATVGNSIAVGDLMAFDLAIALGMVLHLRPPRRVGWLFAGIFTFGGLGSGQFSGAIALVLCAVTVAWATGHLRRLALGFPVVVVAAGLALRPVIDQRLSDFESVSGVPQSWEVRLQNLRVFFWPELRADNHYLLGVRPAARATGPGGVDVFIESGHTWLLWVGGLPLLVAFAVFSWVAGRRLLRVARARRDAVGVAATAGLVALVVMFVLMSFDAHLTLRGSADLLFSLLALGTVSSLPLRPATR